MELYHNEAAINHSNYGTKSMLGFWRTILESRSGFALVFALLMMVMVTVVSLYAFNRL